MRISRIATKPANPSIPSPAPKSVAQWSNVARVTELVASANQDFQFRATATPDLEQRFSVHTVLSEEKSAVLRLEERSRSQPRRVISIRSTNATHQVNFFPETLAMAIKQRYISNHDRYNTNGCYRVVPMPQKEMPRGIRYRATPPS